MKMSKNTERNRVYGGRLVVVGIAVASMVGVLAPVPAAAENFGEAVANTFTNGEFDLQFRYRYEFVDQDSFSRDANASTLRTRLVYKTAKWNDLDFTINMDDVHTIVANNYNSTRNFKTRHPVVADPKGTNLNIAALTYTGLKNTRIVGGRQRIIRANARFIGNVGWRQNEQTYDAISADYQDGPFKVFYGYINRVNRIFGPQSGTPTDAFDSNSHVLDAAYKLNDALSVSVYGYFLDFNNAATASNRTVGLRFTGAPKINDEWTLTYTAELATQDDYKGNPNNYDADYLLGELGVKWRRYSLKAGYEVLEGNGSAGQQFVTPLATAHAHNGWADKFLATPAGGLQDFYIAGSAQVSKGKLALILHDFSSDVGGTDFGTEIDFIVTWRFGEHYSVLGKLAFYDADVGTGNPATGGTGQDTTKGWLQLTAAF